MLPGLFEFLNVELQDVPTSQALAAVAERLNVPVLIDRRALAHYKIDMAAGESDAAREAHDVRRHIAKNHDGGETQGRMARGRRRQAAVVDHDAEARAGGAVKLSCGEALRAGGRLSAFPDRI